MTLWFVIVNSLATTHTDLIDSYQGSPHVPSPGGPQTFADPQSPSGSPRRCDGFSADTLWWRIWRLPLHPPCHRDLSFSLKPTDSTSPLISEQLSHSCHTENTQMVYWHKRATNQYFNLLDCEVILVSFCFILGLFFFVFLLLFFPHPHLSPSGRTNTYTHPAVHFGAWHEHAGRDELVNLQSGHRTLKQSCHCG